MNSIAATINTSANGFCVTTVSEKTANDLRRSTANSTTVSRTAPAALASLL